MVKTRNKTLYWALIGTFVVLYLAVAFVSTLHAITFFQLSNTLGLAILLGAAYEIGQASVLFSILMTENKNRMLAWGMMFLLTALQVTANVYASFKFMDLSGSNDWTYWQRAILFGLQAESPEMYKVIISWISGALLPLVALGMTALVADNIRLVQEETLGGDDEDEKEVKDVEDAEPIETTEPVDDIIEVKRLSEEYDKYSQAEKITKKHDVKFDSKVSTIRPFKTMDTDNKPDSPMARDDFRVNDTFKVEDGVLSPNTVPDTFKVGNDGKISPEPSNKVRGWHLMSEFVDNDHSVFNKGKFIGNDTSKTPTKLKKA